MPCRVHTAPESQGTGVGSASAAVGYKHANVTRDAYATLRETT